MQTQLKGRGTLVDAAEKVKRVHWMISGDYGQWRPVKGVAENNPVSPALGRYILSRLTLAVPSIALHCSILTESESVSQFLIKWKVSCACILQY